MDNRTGNTKSPQRLSLSFAKVNMGIQSVSLQLSVVGLALLFCPETEERMTILSSNTKRKERGRQNECKRQSKHAYNKNI